jgi:hypothetical protein
MWLSFFPATASRYFLSVIPSSQTRWREFGSNWHLKTKPCLEPERIKGQHVAHLNPACDQWPHD